MPAERERWVARWCRIYGTPGHPLKWAAKPALRLWGVLYVLLYRLTRN